MRARWRALLVLLALACYLPGAGSVRRLAPLRIASSYANPSTVIASGRVVGRWVDDVPGVSRFLGIPYAASTAGAGRWAAPSPPEAWAPASLDASAFGPACVQAYGLGDPDVPADQSEDCLSVNVFTPALGRPPGRDLVPVMMFFHGGAFVAGSSHGPWDVYDGSRVAARGDVVVVSANYRLDALGFLVTSAKDSGAVGNYGLLDQRAAMRWVADNIGAFGGDASRVTLWGESAGGMSGLVHMTSPASAGLFSRVIQQSNPAGFSYMTPAHMAVYGDALASKAGCGRPAKGQSQLDCLRAVPAADIMNASLAVVSSYYDVARGSGWNLLDGVLQWGPVVDGAQLPAQPMDVVAAGTLPARVDVLLGHNTDEVATFLDESYYAGLFPTVVFNTVLVSIFGIRGASAVKARYAHTGLPPGVEQLDLIMTDYWFKARCVGVCLSRAVSLLTYNPSSVRQGGHRRCGGAVRRARLVVPLRRKRVIWARPLAALRPAAVRAEGLSRGGAAVRVRQQRRVGLHTRGAGLQRSAAESMDKLCAHGRPKHAAADTAALRRWN